MGIIKRDLAHWVPSTDSVRTRVQELQLCFWHKTAKLLSTIFSVSRQAQESSKNKNKTRVGVLETATWQESNGHVVDPGEYTLLVCHDTRGLGGDQAGAESIKAEEGKCLTHTVTI